MKNIIGENKRTKEVFKYEYGYDEHQRKILIKEENDKAQFAYRTTYDQYGRVLTEKYSNKALASGFTSEITTKNIYDENSIFTAMVNAKDNTVLWSLNDKNAKGQVLKATLGNGIIENKSYNQYGFINTIQTRSNTTNVLDISYIFDTTTGNLTNRENKHINWLEAFSFDEQDRLTEISGDVNLSQSYDNRGRITENSTVGTYNYKQKNSYLVKDIDLNKKGTLHFKTQPVQKISYNASKKPVQINVINRARIDFEYSILGTRSHVYFGGNEENKTERNYTKHYSAISPVEIEESKDGNVKIISYLGGTAYTSPVVDIQQSNTKKPSDIHYLHRDYLGSILAISNTKGKVLEQRQFGAWGTVDKFIKNGTSEVEFKHESSLLNRGYTGHEHFMDVSLIHMNGRMYDANLHRFLSPDNFVQAPFSTQSYNRFGYVWNNPLKYTDESGEFLLLALGIAALFTTETGYDIQKLVSPVALKVDLPSGTHGFGIGLDVSIGIPQIFPISYRYDVGATYYFGSRIGGYASGWQVRNGREWGLGLGLIQYGGTRYRNYSGGKLMTNQVVHTAQLGVPGLNIEYTNDTKGSFPWVADNMPFIPRLGKKENWGDSDSYRTAFARFRFGAFETGVFMHTGDFDDESGKGTRADPRVFTKGNLKETNRSNGIAYVGFLGLKIGWDNESIRHVFQNKVAHDQLWKYNNGSQYPWFEKVARKARFFFQFGSF